MTAFDINLAGTPVKDEVVGRLQKQVVGSRQGSPVWEVFTSLRMVLRLLDERLEDSRLSSSGVHLNTCPVVSGGRLTGSLDARGSEAFEKIAAKFWIQRRERMDLFLRQMDDESAPLVRP